MKPWICPKAEPKKKPTRMDFPAGKYVKKRFSAAQNLGSLQGLMLCVKVSAVFFSPNIKDVLFMPTVATPQNTRGEFV